MINVVNENKRLIGLINSKNRKFNIMEVCGTHTSSINKFGIRSLLQNVNLISGPGCPTCVTPSAYIDYTFNLALQKNIIITSFGDIIRVPGSDANITLERAKAEGAKIKIVNSSMEALELAKNIKVV